MLLSLSFTALLSLVPLVTAQAQGSAWSQCGGITWAGTTTCVTGYYCEYQNPYYSQCVPGTATTSSTTSKTTTSSTSSKTSTSTSSSATSSASAKPNGLNIAAKAAGKKYFGSATDNPELTDAPYVAILSNSSDFGQLTPGNSMKWDATEPERGTFTFTAGQAIVSLAQSNGQLIRGHNCVWYNQLPSWIAAGNFDNATLLSIVEEHCSTIVGNWAGQIYSWDVINEPFNDDGTYRTDIWYNVTGTSYIPTALRAARAADPATKLYINDYNIEGTGAKSTAMVNLVKSLQAEGVPIDGIGIQGHLIVGELPSTIQANLEQFTALGVEVAITELDIRMTLPSTAALLAQQATDYATVITACKNVAGCVGVTVWDYTDKYSWVPSTFSGQGAACPWDENLVPKPAYDGILDAW